MSTTISGSVKDLAAASVGNVFLRFRLRGLNGGIPRVNGVALIAQAVGDGSAQYFYDIVPVNGTLSGTLYSTRDAAGTGNGDIEVGGSLTAVWYGMVLYVGGIPGPEIPVHAKNGATLDPSSVTPITATPVITAPTGDSTYARLDAGNQPFTGNIQAPVVTASTGFRNGTATAGRVLRADGTNFIAAQLNFSDLAGSASAAQLPTPTSTTLGGVKSLLSASHKFLTQIDTTGTPAQAQPSSSDLSDVSTLATLTGTQTLTNKTLGGTGSTTPNTLVNRLKANQGTSLVTGDVGTINAAWGSTATCSAVTGTDTAGSITISSSGTGQSTNPSFVLTFHDGTWTNAPTIICSRSDGSNPQTSQWIPLTVTATAVTFFFIGTPVAGNTYTVSFIAIGK